MEREKLETLRKLGWDDFFRRGAGELSAGISPARVIAVHKGECEVSDGRITAPAKMTGHLRHRAKSRMDYPTVGDWVKVKNLSEDGLGLIQSVIPRRTVLRRKTAGRQVRWQPLAANIDTAFLIQALGPGFSLPRLERYLVMVNESRGIRPVVLLSKRDLLPEEKVEETLRQVRERISDKVPVHAFSNLGGPELEAVQKLFEPGRTHCVVGVSGVGKTSLLNTLLDEEEQRFTLPVREKDGKGVHSTTWRELITLNNGALVIDTPGMRELGHLDAREGIQETFDDILQLAAGCRFNDCAHLEGTPGCAVLAALEDGTLSAARYENFIRLMKESAMLSRAVLEKKEKDRALRRFHKSMQNRERG